MITTRKIGKRTEYTESVRHSCGHTVDYVTLSYKMERRQVAQKRQSPCAKCQLADLLNTPGNAQPKPSASRALVRVGLHGVVGILKLERE